MESGAKERAVRIVEMLTHPPYTKKAAMFMYQTRLLYHGIDKGRKTRA